MAVEVTSPRDVEGDSPKKAQEQKGHHDGADADGDTSEEEKSAKDFHCWQQPPVEATQREWQDLIIQDCHNEALGLAEFGYAAGAEYHPQESRRVRTQRDGYSWSHPPPWLRQR